MSENIVIALIAAIPLTVTAAASFWQMRKANKKLGKTEGSENIMDILRDVLGWQANHDLRHQWLESGEVPKWNSAPALSAKLPNSPQRTDSTFIADGSASWMLGQADPQSSVSSES